MGLLFEFLRELLREGFLIDLLGSQAWEYSSKIDDAVLRRTLPPPFFLAVLLLCRCGLIDDEDPEKTLILLEAVCSAPLNAFNALLQLLMREMLKDRVSRLWLRFLSTLY